MVSDHDIEQRVEELKKEIISKRKDRPYMMIELCKELIQLAEKKDFSYEVAFGNYYLAEINFRVGMSSHLIPYALRTVSIAKKYGYADLECHGYNLLGAFFSYQGDIQTAFSYYLQGLDVAKRYRMKRMQVILYNNLGDMNMELKDYDAAIYYFNKMEESASKNLHDKNRTDIYYDCTRCCNLVLIYLSLSEYEKATAYMKQMLSLMTDWYFEQNSCAIYYLLARLNYVRGKMDQVKLCSDLFVKYAYVNQDQSLICDTYLPMTEFFLEHDMMEHATKIVDLVSELSTNIQNPYQLVKISEVKVKYYQKLGQKDDLLWTYEEYFNYQQMHELEEEKARRENIKIQIELHQSTKMQQDMLKKNKKLEEMSEHDALTGLLNRYSINKYCDRVFNEACKKQTNYLVILIDIDYFKQYNDTYGHIEGDKCISIVAKKMEELAGDKLMTIRYGGDEFMITGMNMDDESVYKFTKLLKEEIENLKIEHSENKVSDYVTITQGVVNLIPKRRDDTLVDFIHMADLALYKVKRNVRNSIGFYEDIDD